MVAISLYRGHLHRAPDIPRRWLMPTPHISLKDFKSLLHRRNKALSRLRSSNPNPDLKPHISPMPNGPPIELKLEAQPELEPPEDLKTGPPPEEGKVEVIGGSDGGDCSVRTEHEQPEKDDNLQVDEKLPEETKENIEVSEKANALSAKEKRKRDIKEKLQVLNAKKHNLVQALKQILNMEELKRRNSRQGMVIHLAVPLQVKKMNDSGSVTRLGTSKMGSEANLAGENEGGEADDVSNLNVHSRQMFRMSNTSPSSESPLGRPTYIQHNLVPYPSRASMGVSVSPSCFAPTGYQGLLRNPPAVSLSGTNFVALSPSPVVSGGTSVFKEARQPSPRN